VSDQQRVRLPSPVTPPPATPTSWATKFTTAVELPGSEWVYAKLYSSPRQVQALLRREIPSLLARLRAQGYIKEWFFFRYGDPDWHVRLRLLCSSRSQLDRVRQLIDTMVGSLERKGAIWRAQYDTYFREVERFGGDEACRWIERLFCVESDIVVLALRRGLVEEPGSLAAMSLALAWTFRTWSRLGLRHSEVARLSRALRHAMVEQQILHRARSRAVRPRSYEAMDVNTRPWRIHTLRAGRALDRVRALADAGGLGVTVSELAGDLSHLFVNRLFPTPHVEWEFELYQALERQAHREMARAASR